MSKPLAGRTFAHLQPLHQSIHGQRRRRDEKQPVEFAHGFWHAEQANEPDEQVDGLDFQLGQIRRWRPRNRGLLMRVEFRVSRHRGELKTISDKLSIKK